MLVTRVPSGVATGPEAGNAGRLLTMTRETTHE